MVKIDDVLLKRLQKLSMIEIDEDNKEQIENELNQFLEFVDILNELDLENLEATFNPLNKPAPLREDIPKPQPQIAKKILKNAPKSVDDFFIVPKIID
jgi:aspartyl-tRNA(Asn)/glutamyl-tRNA(Gln) amidotransferase subunit C